MEGNLYMFNIFEKLDEYERDRIQSDKQNDKEAAIKIALSVEQEDAESLLNDIDMEFEANFDANLNQSLRKESSLQNFAQHAIASLKPQKLSSDESVSGGGGFSSSGNLTPTLGGVNSQGNMLGKSNRGFGGYHNKQLTIDYED